MSTASKPVRRLFLVPVFLVLAWLVVGGAFGSYAGKLGEVATNDQASFLPQSAESTRVVEAQKAFSSQETVPAVVVWTSAEGRSWARSSRRRPRPPSLRSRAGRASPER